MDLRNEIKSLIAKKGQTIKSVCETLELQSNTKISPNNITNKLRRGTIKFDEVEAIISVLGYHIEFVENN